MDKLLRCETGDYAAAEAASYRRNVRTLRHVLSAMKIYMYRVKPAAEQKTQVGLITKFSLLVYRFLVTHFYHPEV